MRRRLTENRGTKKDYLLASAAMGRFDYVRTIVESSEIEMVVLFECLWTTAINMVMLEKKPGSSTNKEYRALFKYLMGTCITEVPAYLSFVDKLIDLVDEGKNESEEAERTRTLMAPSWYDLPQIHQDIVEGILRGGLREEMEHVYRK